MTLLTIISMSLFWYVWGNRIDVKLKEVGWVEINPSEESIMRKQKIYNTETSINKNKIIYGFLFLSFLAISIINLLSKMNGRTISILLTKALSLITICTSCAGIYYLYIFK